MSCNIRSITSYFCKQSGHSMFLGNLFSNGELYLPYNQRYHHSILSNSLLPSYYMLSGPYLLVFTFLYLPYLILTHLFPQEFSSFSILLENPYYCWSSLFCSLIIQWDWRMHWGIFDEKQALQPSSSHPSWSLPWVFVTCCLPPECKAFGY